VINKKQSSINCFRVTETWFVPTVKRSNIPSQAPTLNQRAKAKAVPLYAIVALEGEEVYLLLIFDLGSRWR
jgi:hypothetical protein